jgi:tellurite resistance protein
MCAAIDAMQDQLAKQVLRIGKASAAAEIERDDDGTEKGPVVIELPAAVAAIRGERPSELPLAEPVSRGPNNATGPTLDAEAQTESGGDSRVAELEAEIERVKQKHRAQLVLVERDLAKLRARQRGGAATESRSGTTTPPAAVV